MKIYCQRDYPKVKLGFSKYYTIASVGCFLTCLSMMVGKDPVEVNEILKKANAFSGANMISDRAAKALNFDLLRGDDPKIPGKMNNVNYMPNWSPTIKEVKFKNTQHFVIRAIDKNNPVASSFGTYIVDPWDGKMKAINTYPFVSYRLFKK